MYISAVFQIKYQYHLSLVPAAAPAIWSQAFTGNDWIGRNLQGTMVFQMNYGVLGGSCNFPVQRYKQG